MVDPQNANLPEVLAFWDRSCPKCREDGKMLQDIRKKNPVRVFDFRVDILERCLFGVDRYPFYVILVDRLPVFQTGNVRDLL